MPFHRPILGLLGLIALSACSTSSDITPLMPATAPIPTAALWSVSVTGCQRPPDCNRLRTSLIYNLTAAKVLQHAAPPGQPAPLSLDVVVIHLNTVTDAARAQRAILAGHNQVVGIATLKDASGTKLRAFRVETEGSALPFIDDSSSADVGHEFAQGVIAGIKG